MTEESVMLSGEQSLLLSMVAPNRFIVEVAVEP